MHDLEASAIHDSRRRRLHAYWRDRHVGSRPPGRADLDPLEFRYAIGFVSLIDVEHGPLRFRFRLVAMPVTSHLGYEMTGRYLDTMPEVAMRAYLDESYRRVATARKPLYERGERVLDRRVWRHESMLLPCCSTAGEINMIVSARITETPRWLTDSGSAG